MLTGTGVSMAFSRFSKYIASGVVLGLGFAATASAALVVADAPPPPNFSITMKSATTGQYNVPIGSITPIANGDTWNYQIDGAYTRGGYEVTYSFLIDPDPSVFGNIVFKNVSAVTGDYTMDFNLSVSPGFNPSKLSGSV